MTTLRLDNFTVGEVVRQDRGRQKPIYHIERNRIGSTLCGLNAGPMKKVESQPKKLCQACFDAAIQIHSLHNIKFRSTE